MSAAVERGGGRQVRKNSPDRDKELIVVSWWAVINVTTRNGQLQARAKSEPMIYLFLHGKQGIVSTGNISLWGEIQQKRRRIKRNNKKKGNTLFIRGTLQQNYSGKLTPTE